MHLAGRIFAAVRRRLPMTPKQEFQEGHHHDTKGSGNCTGDLAFFGKRRRGAIATSTDSYHAKTQPEQSARSASAWSSDCIPDIAHSY